MKTCYPNAVNSTSIPVNAPDKTRNRFTSFIHNIHFSAMAFTCFMAISSSTQAQLSDYGFLASSGVSLETGSFTNLLGTFVDDGVSAQENIGFTFNYDGVDYTDFSVTSNGLLALGTTAVTDYDNITGNLTGPYLFPYWDNNYTDADGFVQFQLKGAPGSRKLIIEYSLSYAGQTGTADKLFQIWLYETSNMIQFVYGAGNDFNDSYSVGILTNGAMNFQSVTVSSGTASSSVAMDNNTTWPGAGTSYLFGPSGSLPVNFTAFEYNCQNETTEVSWTTDSEINCDRYELEMSRNGLEYQLIATINGNGTTTQPSTYTLPIDKHQETQYVRVRQVDMDGKSDIYGPFSVMCEATDVVVYPNPAREEVHLICPKKTQEATIEVYNCNATLVYTTTHNFKKSTMTTLDLHTLKAGTYLIKLIELDETSVHLIVKE
ncbi:MAG: T9SS type A sorting domain-containing protein [Bacteroidota bacterium]